MNSYDPANEQVQSTTPTYEMDDSRPSSSKDRNPNMVLINIVIKIY